MESLSFDLLFALVDKKLAEEGIPLPSVSQIALTGRDAYKILFSTILSLRTKDAVTIEASMRLFEKADDIKAFSSLDEETVSSLIYPVAFYKRKASSLKKIADILIKDYDGEVPSTMEALLALPSVGLKTASLTLNLAYGINAICVDCHVHQVLNRLGLVDTKSAEETEKVLRKILDEKYWIPLNERLVMFGQRICTPISPFCSACPLEGYCAKKGVRKSR
ncbi:MAG TPA: endonuclease III [Candidatus Ornithospirochaeta avicola]|uniref:Endonuclease III n=1 Tax=Candidatus Ornithospirochaeta avicola TaxID=2840896 RepID=A0A9D1PS70_9SPIO|nr:endonuclease III [Candidatus Ornithospirochaeta avicola]